MSIGYVFGEFGVTQPHLPSSCSEMLHAERCSFDRFPYFKEISILHSVQLSVSVIIDPYYAGLQLVTPVWPVAHCHNCARCIAHIHTRTSLFLWIRPSGGNSLELKFLTDRQTERQTDRQKENSSSPWSLTDSRCQHHNTHTWCLIRKQYHNIRTMPANVSWSRENLPSSAKRYHRISHPTLRVFLKTCLNTVEQFNPKSEKRYN